MAGQRAGSVLFRIRAAFAARVSTFDVRPMKFPIILRADDGVEWWTDVATLDSYVEPVPALQMLCWTGLEAEKSQAKQHFIAALPEIDVL